MTLNNFFGGCDGVVGQYDTPISFKYDVSLKSTIRKPEIPGKCH